MTPLTPAVPVLGIFSAALALVRAATLADQGGGAAALMRHSAGATARRWTHAGFVETMSSFWRDQMGVIP